MPDPQLVSVQILPPDSFASILSISPDGRTILLQADGLTADDADFGSDLYAWNRDTGAFTLIGKEPPGAIQGNGVSRAVQSADGRYVAFVTDAQLVPEDTDIFFDDDGNPHGAFSLYLHDQVTGTTQLISRPQTDWVDPSYSLSFSADSSTLVFDTDASASAEDTDIFGPDVYSYDIASGTLRLAGGDRPGYTIFGGSLIGGGRNAISADGRWVAIESNEPLTADDADRNFRDVFLFDTQTGDVKLASPTTPGGLDEASVFIEMSKDGETLLFYSLGQLVPEDTDGGLADIYAWDRSTGAVTLLTETVAGGVDGAASFASISADRNLIVVSTAAQLTADDSDLEQDAYLLNRATGAVELISQSIAGSPEGQNFAEVSASGRYVLINAYSQLLAEDTDSARDAYVMDLETGTLVLATGDVPDGSTLDYDGRTTNLDSGVLWLKSTFGGTFYRWDIESGSTTPVPRDGTVPVAYEFSADGLSTAYQDSPSGAIYWFGPGEQKPGVVRRGTDAADTLTGTAGADELHGGKGNDVLQGLAGADRLFGEKNEDAIHGGDGDDYALGGWQNDRLYGDAGDDRLIGDLETIGFGSRGANDRLEGGAGDDILLGDGATILARGTGGRDTLIGGDGDDRLVGDAELIARFGRGGDDRLQGGAGDDLLFGDAQLEAEGAQGGNDWLEGGAGDDGLWGGTGNDLFVYAASGFGDDSIYDFGQRPGDDDRIDLRAFDIRFSDLAIEASSVGIVLTSAAFGEGSIFLSGIQSVSASDFIFG